ncbi:hypothetical protein [Hydrogenimonas sp.]
MIFFGKDKKSLMISEKKMERETGVEPEGREAKADGSAFVGPHDGGDVREVARPDVERSGVREKFVSL